MMLTIYLRQLPTVYAMLSYYDLIGRAKGIGISFGLDDEDAAEEFVFALEFVAVSMGVSTIHLTATNLQRMYLDIGIHLTVGDIIDGSICSVNPFLPFAAGKSVPEQARYECLEPTVLVVQGYQEEEVEDDVKDTKQKLMEIGVRIMCFNCSALMLLSMYYLTYLLLLQYTDVYRPAPSDRERVESITKERQRMKRGSEYKVRETWYPCPSQSAAECASHAIPDSPKRWRGRKLSAVNGGVTKCNMCVGLELNLMRNGTSFIFTHPSDLNRYRQADFAMSAPSEERWHMHSGVAVPPINLKQMDEGLLEVYRRQLQQQQQPEVMLVKNSREKARYADLRAQGTTRSEMRGEQHPLELDIGKFKLI